MIFQDSIIYERFGLTNDNGGRYVLQKVDIDHLKTTIPHETRQYTGCEDEVGWLSLHGALESKVIEFANEINDWRDSHKKEVTSAITLKDRAFWVRTGPEFPSAKRHNQNTAGMLAIEAVCTDPDRVIEYERWYNTVHVPDMLSTELYHTAYRFRNLAYKAGRGAFLALYETEIDPMSAKQMFWEQFRPKWIEAGRVIDTMKVVSAASYRVLL